jgi:hypothetical protein
MALFCCHSRCGKNNLSAETASVSGEFDHFAPKTVQETFDATYKPIATFEEFGIHDFCKQ